MNIKYEDYSDILTKREISFLYKNGSLGEKYPNALEFWDNEKNLPLTPYIVLSSSNKIVHWKCPICKYEWDDKIITRRDAIKCPVCSSRIVKQGCNDFATKFPDLALEWDYDKNDCDYSPSTVAFSSHKKDGGNVEYVGIHGLHLLTIEPMDKDVRFVDIKLLVIKLYEDL